jgi:hypothetical protein
MPSSWHTSTPEEMGGRAKLFEAKRSAKRLLARTPSIYYRLGYAVLLGIVHRMLPWRPATQALDSTITFLNTIDCRTRRRARQPRTAQMPTSCTLCWCIARRSGGIPAIVAGRLPSSWTTLRSPSPLRTGHDSFPSSGSSTSNASFGETRFRDGKMLAMNPVMALGMK